MNDLAIVDLMQRWQADQKRFREIIKKLDEENFALKKQIKRYEEEIEDKTDVITSLRSHLEEAKGGGEG
jgi:chromosome segregation ATPase